MKTVNNIYNEIISPENLFLAWDEFKRGKQHKKDVQRFEWNLEENIFKLYRELKNKTYQHGPYESFYIHDPKQRHIHKALVSDRILHHAIFAVINPIFEQTFISTSFSCRVDFGVHKGVGKFGKMVRKISQNGFRRCFVLKCDIRKFFDTIDHNILLEVIKKRVQDNSATWLLEEIIRSFTSPHFKPPRHKGLPIGNLTSQLFANIYMNVFDQFMKHRLGVKYYARYTDDFVIVADNEEYLLGLIPIITTFLKNTLELELHPNKILIRKLGQGVDFLGYITFLKHRLLRSKTKRRIMAKLQRRINEYRAGLISEFTLNQSVQSYLGVMSHANTHNLGEQLKNNLWFWLNE